MSTKTLQLAQSIDPIVREYIESVFDDVFELLSSRIRAEHDNNIADHKVLLTELGDIRAKLVSVNSLIATDPTHKITKSKILAVAKELNL